MTLIFRPEKLKERLKKYIDCILLGIGIVAETEKLAEISPRAEIAALIWDLMVLYDNSREKCSIQVPSKYIDLKMVR